MSFLNKVFGQKVKKAPSLPEAIQKLKVTEEILVKKQVYLEGRINKEVDTAKKNASKNKKAALQALQRKKRLEQQLQQVDGALTTLESQREVLENANINNLAVNSIQNASKSLKSIHKDINVEKVEEILDDLSEQTEITDEISEAISNPVAFVDDTFDEDELEKELSELTADLENLELDKVLPSVPPENIKNPTKRKVKQMLPAP